MSNGTNPILPLSRPVTYTYELKPTWQRAGAAGLVCLGGGIFAASMHFARTRNVRSLDLREAGRKVYFESVADKRGKGTLLDRKECQLVPNKGMWWLVRRLYGCFSHILPSSTC